MLIIQIIIYNVLTYNAFNAYKFVVDIIYQYT